MWVVGNTKEQLVSSESWSVGPTHSTIEVPRQAHGDPGTDARARRRVRGGIARGSAPIWLRPSLALLFQAVALALGSRAPPRSP